MTERKCDRLISHLRLSLYFVYPAYKYSRHTVWYSDYSRAAALQTLFTESWRHLSSACSFMYITMFGLQLCWRKLMFMQHLLMSASWVMKLTEGSSLESEVPCRGHCWFSRTTHRHNRLHDSTPLLTEWTLMIHPGYGVLFCVIGSHFNLSLETSYHENPL